MEQSFDTSPHVSVSKNTTLSDDFVVNIQNCLTDITAKLGMLICDIVAFIFLIVLSIVDDLCPYSYFSCCLFLTACWQNIYLYYQETN